MPDIEPLATDLPTEVAPRRIQRKRIKGWRMPDGAVYVGRPSGWGNPFRPGEPFKFWDHDDLRPFVGVAGTDRGSLVNLFRKYLSGRPGLQAEIEYHLAGRDLVCWCPLDQPCHADVLLEIANGGA